MLIKNTIKKVDVINEKQQQANQHFDNLYAITIRFLEGLDKEPERMKEFAPHWINQMDATMKWYQDNGVNSDCLYDMFDIINEVFVSNP